MSVPSPDDLFLNMWASAMSDEDNNAIRPGSPEWEKNSKNACQYWTKIWIGCKQVCEHIRDFEHLASSYANITDEEESVETKEETEEESS